MRLGEPVSTELVSPHSLQAQLAAAPLMNRVDTKYLLTKDVLGRLVEGLPNHYSILETEGTRWFTYDTVYYDTPERHLYAAHHNGKLNRYKVRTRHYRDAGLTFLEVKHKNNQRRTIKHRIPLDNELELADGKPLYSEAIERFLAHTAGLSAAGMLPTLFVQYRRATLMNQCAEERITVDVDLRFRCLQTGEAIALPHYALVEAKCASKQASSEMAHRLKCLGIHATKFSKYCVGSALLHRDCLKTNRFKPVLDRLTTVPFPFTQPLASSKEVPWNPPQNSTLLSA